MANTVLKTIQEDLKQAQLQRDDVKVSTLRMLLSEIQYSAISKAEDRQEVSGEIVLQVVQREVKKRRESIVSFKQGGREDLVQREEAELQILEKYLPEQMSNEELSKIIDETLKEVGLVSDMGRVMSAVMSRVAGKADGGRVSQIVKEKLNV